MKTPLRDRILDAATRLFAQQGYAQTSMRGVAEAVGCTKPALYYHFGSKEDLFVATVQQHLDEYTEQLQAMLAAGGTLKERLKASFETHLYRIQQRPEVMRLLMTIEHRPEQGLPVIDLMSMHEEHDRLIQQLLSEGVARGEIRSDLNLQDVSTSVVGLVHIWGMHCLHGQVIPPDLPERIMDIFLHGVAPHER